MLPTHNSFAKSKELDQNVCEENEVRDEVIQIWRAGHFSLHIGVIIQVISRVVRGDNPLQGW